MPDDGQGITEPGTGDPPALVLPHPDKAIINGWRRWDDMFYATPPQVGDITNPNLTGEEPT